MKLVLVVGVLGLSTVFAAACSSDDEAAAEMGPVAATPLTGSIDGKTFEAKSAIAREASTKAKN